MTAVARAIIDDNAYMTLATADTQGTPWATPVWYAHEAYTRFLWISRPGARHSQNLATRPQLGIVIFDSHSPIGTGQGVYLEAVAGEVPEAEIGQAMAAFSRRSLAQGGKEFTPADVGPPASHRLYRATVSRLFLGINDQRSPVSL